MIPVVTEENTKHITAPMPGKLLSVDVKVGDTVEVGQPMLVLEAMKMQNVLHAEKSGIITLIRFNSGDDVSVDEVLIELE